jgi:23S rRNA pseudouridine1911/1915/1917 synthase
MQSPEIIYEDRHLVAVSKPARIPVASESSGDETLLDMVRSWNAARQTEGRKGYCVPIHFLDRPVSGVILFGLSSKAAARLNELFRGRQLRKIYVAIVEGRPSESEATLEHWLAKDHDENKALVVHAKHPDAKKCVLSYRVIGTSENRTLLQVEPVTGRSHQIRAQLAAIGSPIYGDSKYGSSGSWDGKVALHAACLEFKHPVGSAPMRLIAALPTYWKDVWKIPFSQAPNNFIYREVTSNE